MKIQVTREHIDKGEIQDSCECAVALALKEYLWPEVRVAVSDSEIMIEGLTPYNIQEMETPGFVSDFIMAFDELNNDDDRSALKPFEFDLDIPVDFLKVAI